MPKTRKFEFLRTSYEKFLPFVSLVVLAIVLSAFSKHFFTWQNISSIIRQHAQIIVMAVGMTFIIASGGIDLSIGSGMALAGICGTVLMTMGVPIVWSVMVGCVAGLVCGAINGVLISCLRISPFIATLGTMQVFRGLVLVVTKGLPVDVGIPRSFGNLRNGNLSDIVPPSFFGYIPVPVMLIPLVGALIILLLVYTPLAKRLCADRIPLSLTLILLVGAHGMLMLRYGDTLVQRAMREYLFASRIPISLILILLIALLASLILRMRRPAALLSILVLTAGVLGMVVLRVRMSMPKPLVRVLEFIPIPLILIVVIAILASLTLRYTRLGRYSYAIGSNVEAARHSGIRVAKYLVLIYAVGGFLTGLAGMIEFSSLVSGQPTAGVGYELRVIAAVVIGGGSLMGGEGTVSGTIVGALLMALILNGCTLLGISDFVQQIVMGALIVLAVTFDQLRRRRLGGDGL